VNSTFANELLTKKQVAQLRKQSTRTVDRDIENGRFPKGLKLGSGKGGAVRWPRAVVEQWIAEKMADQ
jgi:predicted DNA-binding transcriptional regulator AlpA